MNSPMWGAARRRGLVVALVLLLSAYGCTTAGEMRSAGPTLMQMAQTLGTDVMRALVRGYVPGRSGEILLVPKPWNVLGQWNEGLRGSADPRTTHSTPWSYHQRVPIALYGPGYVRPGRRSDRPVDVADIAPTIAELLEFRFDAPNGEPLREALVPRPRRPGPPRAIVVVVVDGGGWNVLRQWPDAWPEQRGLMRLGTTFTNATIASAPSVTAPVHATIGTGAYPRVHGIAENTARLPDGSIASITGDGDLSLMRSETVADAWDRANGDRAWVGMFGFEFWHLGMMGKGALTGDRDVAVLWDRERKEFAINRQLYLPPPSLPSREVLDRRLRDLDASDGALDGLWDRNALDETSYQFTANPAFAAYQGDAAIRIAREAPLGRDDVTDLLFVELKVADIAGHVWNMLGEEVRTVLEVQDRILGELVRTLDRRVGRGRYVLAMTADHGQTPVPEENGGLRIDRFLLLDNLNAVFGDAIETVHPSDLYVKEGATPPLETIARFLGDYRFGDGLPDGLDASDIPTEVLQERVFAAALPGWFLESLSPADIAALGPGRYAEGDLSTPPRVGAIR